MISPVLINGVERAFCLSAIVDFVKVGRVHSTQGLKGEIFIQIFSGETCWLSDLESLYLSEETSNHPEKELKIKKRRLHKKKGLSGFVVQVEGGLKIEDVEPLVGQTLYLPESFLVSAPGENIFLREIQGFKILDASRGFVGTVRGFSDNGAQDLVLIKAQDQQDFEVPLVEPILISIDFELEQIKMDIPLGLVPGDEL